jgi:PAS domain S-box-containing protein
MQYDKKTTVFLATTVYVVKRSAHMSDATIAFILPSTLVCKTIRKVLDRAGYDYPVFELSTGSALKKARELIAVGARIIVSHGLTYEHLHARLNIPLLELPFSGIEAAVAVKSALRHSNKIIHMGTKRLNRYLNKSLELLGLDQGIVTFYKVTDERPLEEQAQEAIDAGYEVIIGGFATVNYAKRCGKIGVEFDVDEQVIETAIDNAREIVRNMVEEEAKRELINAILNSVSEGIVAIDRERRILLANPAARDIIGLSPESGHGLTLEETMANNGVVDVLQPGETPLSRDAVRVVLKEMPVIVGNQERGKVVSITKAEEIQGLESKIRKQIVLKGLVAKNRFVDIFGSSGAITHAKECARAYALYDSTVLITGETGTGKELFAQSIHNESKRKNQPFVAVNCASLPENLIESELFGYVKGAFTGASKEGKIGLFETAGNGTIFLDEISEIPLSIQAKLFRVLQEREIIRIGSDSVIRINARIICSSNKDLLKLVNAGKFKEDLYYRLCVLEVTVPPLRERREDIPIIAHSLIRRFNRRHGKTVVSIIPDVLSELEKMPLHGNVRELGNILERMVILAEGVVIDRSVLAKSNIRTVSTPYSKGEADASAPSGRTLREIQHAAIMQALERTSGNKSAAARLLGINATTLWRRLNRPFYV